MNNINIKILSIPKLLRCCNLINTSALNIGINKLVTETPISGDWWDDTGTFKALHSMNHLRTPFIRDNILQNMIRNENKAKPLNGIELLDVGCGGGILSEPLANIGANATGIDTEENIELAIKHASYYPLIKDKLNYKSISIEEMAQHSPNSFDGCIASEVVEHVKNLESFIKSCIQILKPGGLFFATTINKTWMSRIFAITIAEDILKLLPKGMHDWQNFVSPQQLETLLGKNDCSVKKVQGMSYNPFTNRWKWSRIDAVNYAICAQKH